MKLTTLLLTITLLQVSASVLAQKVSLQLKDVQLTTVLSSIKQQTGYNILYPSKLRETSKKVSIQVENQDLAKVLDLCFENQPFEYTIAENTVIVKERPVKSNPRTITSTEENNIPIEEDQDEINVRGKIVDQNNQPLFGATILIKGSTDKRFFTDTNGEFFIQNIKKNSVLSIHYVGFDSKEISASTEYLQIKLVPSINEVEEVAVISTGYQHIRPEHSTGAISQLSTKEYESRISTNFLDGLVNRLPGLMINNDVTFTSTNPNGGTNSRPLFNVRGISTMSANQQPLIVIDGYPTELTLNMIDPNEIKSITLLKDAAAATVYGVRASNGVIVIERKQASIGKPRFAFRATAGITPEENYSRYRWADNASSIIVDYERTRLASVANKDTWSLLGNSAQNRQVHSKVFYILAQQAAGIITNDQAERAFDELKAYDNLDDYQRLFQRPLVTQTYNFNVSGGNENALYYITANYTDNSLSNIKNNDNRFLLSARTTLKLSKKLTLELTTDYQEERGNSAPVPGVRSYQPFERFRDDEGSPTPIISQSISPWYNDYLISQGLDDHMFYPLVDLYAQNNKGRNVNNRITANFTYDLGKGFNLLFGGIYETSRSENKNYYSEVSSRARSLVNSYVVRNEDGSLQYHVPKGGHLTQQNGQISSYTARAQLNYNKIVGASHSFNGILGAEVRNLTSSGNTSSLFGYNDGTLLHQPINLASLTTNTISGTYQLGSPLDRSYSGWFNQQYVEDRFVSAYANMVYSYKNTYSLTGSIRIDQSNLFGTNPKYKYKPLWSVGAGWNIHQEEFLQDASWIDQLKLRAAYGFNGNVAKMSLPQVIATSGFNLYTSPSSPMLRKLSYANNSLRWEQTSNFNVGIDYRIFKNITGNVDYYHKNGTDLMGNAFIDPTIGNSPSLINQATIKNKGLEIAVRADWIAKPDFNWNTGIVIGRNTSKVVEVYQSSNYNPSTLNQVGYVQGYPVGALFAFRYAGLDSAGYSMVQNEEGQRFHTDNNSIGNPTAALMASDTSGIIRYMGSSIPTINVGLSNRVDFGRFYVFCMINYYGGFKMHLPRPNPTVNRPLAGAENYWKQPGDEARTEVMGLAAYNSRNSNDAYNYADTYVVNGDYITLGDLTVSYRIDHLPLIKRAGFSNFEIKGQASNIYTVGLNKYNYSRATGDYSKSYVTPTFTLGIFTNF